jgi:flavin-dependent dehydrogenase
VERDCDLLILGGGPAGTATAIALARLGYSVSVVERSQYDSVRAGETLPPAIKPSLVRLGVWEQFLHQNPSPSPAILTTWGSGNLEESSYLFNPHGSGWHIDRARYDGMLAEAAAAAGATVYRRARLRNCTKQPSGYWRLEIAGENGSCRLQARLLVDATGRAAALARSLGARRVSCDRLVGVIAFLDPSSETMGDHCTLVEARRDGWWYSALLPTGRTVAAWMTDADFVPRRRDELRGYWLRQLRLAPCTASRMRRLQLSGEPRIVAATTSRLDHLIGPDWLAMGDAAAAVDPLSGQGVSYALEAGDRAACAIAGHLSGDAGALPAYASWVAGRFAVDLQARAACYTQEQRWTASPFWQRRQLTGWQTTAVGPTAS